MLAARPLSSRRATFAVMLTKNSCRTCRLRQPSPESHRSFSSFCARSLYPVGPDVMRVDENVRVDELTVRLNGAHGPIPASM